MMTLMAVDIGVFALGPLFVRLVMHMASKAGVGIVFKIIINLISNKAHQKNEYQSPDRYDDFRLWRQFF